MLVWLADQLNSLVTVVLDVEYLICFYIFLKPASWNIDVKRDICSPLSRPLNETRVNVRTFWFTFVNIKLVA